MLFSSIDGVNAQRRRRKPRSGASIIMSEVGGNIGISNFQGDFYNKGPLDGAVTINGFTINGTYSLHLVPKRRTQLKSLKNHMVLKTNFGYTSASFNHFGISTGKEPLDKPLATDNTDNNILLGRLETKTSIITLGTQLEFYYKDLVNYLHRSSRSRSRSRSRRSMRGRISRGNPYAAVGFAVNLVKSTPSDPFKDGKLAGFGSNTDFPGYPDNYTPEVIKGINEIVLSPTFALGYRYKITPSMDLVGEMKFIHYFSDRIDGVDTDVSPKIDDKSNDYNTTITAGLIYHLF